jgi:hypothetical protein
LNGTLVILAMCEGNKCQEEMTGRRGEGRLVAMRKTVVNDTCTWETIRKIHIPRSAHFLDYSAITMNEEGRVALTSQEDSRLWIGQLNGRNEDGLWDIDAIEFDETVAQVYDFPRDHHCDIIYCNIEGIFWMNDNMVMAVSDKMKGKGMQNFRCFEKDQSVHVFVIP